MATRGGAVAGGQLDGAWRIVLIGGLALVVLHLVLPGTALNAATYLGLAAVGVASVWVGAARGRGGEAARPWQLLAVGLTLFFVGDLVYYYRDLILESVAFPSLADAFYYSSYPFLVAAPLLLVRRHRRARDRAVPLEAAIIAVGLGTLSWVFVMEPGLADTESSVFSRVVAVGYPLMDVVLLAIVAQLALSGVSRRPAYGFLAVGLVSLMVADATSGIDQLSDAGFHVGTFVDAGWMAFYLLNGVASLHPSARDVGSTVDAAPPALGWRRLLVLGAVCLLSPMVLAIEWANDDLRQVPVLLGSSMILFSLVVARMATMAQAMARTAARERSLRNGSALLVTATNTAEIHAAAVDAARALLERPTAMVLLAVGDSGDEVRVVASSGAGAPAVGTAIRTDLDHPTVDLAVCAAVAAVAPEQADHLVSATLTNPGGLRGVLAASSATAFEDGVGDALQTLASQVALALEGAALAEEAMRRQGEQRFRSLVQTSSDVITVVERDATITYQTPSVAAVLGHAPEDLAGTSLLDLVHPDDRPHALAFVDGVASRRSASAVTPLRMRHRDGTWVDTEAVGNNLLDDPAVRGIVLTARDVSERKAFEAQLHQQAFHDPLTGLANRFLFADRVAYALARREIGAEPVCVLFVDLDDFKTINDSLGHGAGDRLLVAVATKLQACVRPSDTTARLGGDEFAILLPSVLGKGAATRVAERIMETLREPIAVEGRDVFVRVSIGIAFAENEGVQSDELLRNADVAMYTAKSLGKGRWEVFQPQMHEAAVERLHLKADLQRALDNGDFVLHFQPIVRLDDGGLSGVEALVRWHHAERGMVPPNQFIPLSEETGLILPLGEWVLEEACRHARRWSFRERGLTMSVNVSAKQLQRPELVGEVGRILAASDVDAGTITIEVTESTLVHDIDVSVLHELRRLGVGLAIDDFGTGYSSLSYLRQLPIDVLKIDREFVNGIERRDGSLVLVGTVIELARSLGLQTTAEGVELEEQRAELRALGCGLAQGYLFSRPLPAEQLEALLDLPMGGAR